MSKFVILVHVKGDHSCIATNYPLVLPQISHLYCHKLATDSGFACILVAFYTQICKDILHGLELPFQFNSYFKKPFFQ